MLALARRLYEGLPVTRRDIEQRFNVSRSTAKRYMVRLECALPVVAEIGERRTLVLRIVKAENPAP